MDNNLSPSMQERLDKWKANLSRIKTPEILKKKSPGNFVPRHRDYGDDMKEFEEKPKENNE